MAYDLDAFCEDVKGILSQGDGDEAREKVRLKLEDLLKNKDFVDTTCGPSAEPGTHTLYHDPELDFMVLAHIQTAGRKSPPHDHGASWAIYGQAVEWTEMTEYDQNDDGSRDGYADIELRRTYKLEPGDAGTFGPHQIHSIHFPDDARFVRVTGTDLTHIPTRRFDVTKKSVVRIDPNNTGDVAGAATA